MILKSFKISPAWPRAEIPDMQLPLTSCSSILDLRLQSIYASLCRAHQSQLTLHVIFPTASLLTWFPTVFTPQQFILANAEIREEAIQSAEKLTLLGMIREPRSLFAKEPSANVRGQTTVVFIYTEPFFISRSLDLQAAGQAVRNFQN